MNCYYCDQILAADPSYSARPAEFDLGSEAPRCAWHWRFLCDHCGDPGHFMARFHCPTSDRLLCRNIASGKFVTFCYAVIDTAARTVSYANAGHFPPVLMHTDGRVDRRPAVGWQSLVNAY